MNHFSKRPCLLLTFVLLLCMFAISAGAQTITAQYLYAIGSAPTGTQGRIAGYRIAANGTLTLTQSAFPTSEPVGAVVPSAQGAKLFALGLHKVWVYAVNPADGTLRLLSSDTFPQNIQGLDIAVNPTSTLLFVGKVVDPGTANAVRRITTYRISSTGVITSIASAVVANLEPHIAVDNTGRFLYASVENPADFTTNIETFSVNSTTGALTFAGTAQVASGATSNIVLHPGNKFLYAGLQTPEVAAFVRNATSGALTRTQISQCNCDTGPDFGNGIAVNGSGTVLAEATGQDGGIAIYTINQTTGTLTPQGGSFISIPFETPQFAVDKANGLIYALDVTAHTIKGFHVTNAGVTSPTAQGSVPFPADDSPFALQVVAVKR